MCVDVLFADGSKDTLLLSRPHMDAPSVLKGTLRSDRATKAVVILRDENNPEATVSAEMTTKDSCYQILGIRPNKLGGITQACLCNMNKIQGQKKWR